ncbi:MAG: alpha/beta hydrolase [Solirubrobacteraceae bacterium]
MTVIDSRSAPTQTLGERQKVRFPSGGEACVAWHYPGINGACITMAAGGGVPKEPGTDPFATPFHQAGFSVLAFDYRRLGESGGQPRQIIRIGEQIADWRAAIELARTLPEVDPARVAVWGYSLSGGHVFAVAARDPRLAAAIAHAPLADGQAAMPNAMRHQSPLAALRMTGRGVLDAIGGLFGHEPRLVPLAGPRGTMAMLTTPDAQEGAWALDPEGRYAGWRQEIAARSALRIGLYRPGRFASRVQCPLLVTAHENDQSALPGPAIKAARRAPRGELARVPGGHYGGYLDAHARAVETELGFLRRHLLDRSPALHVGKAEASGGQR